MNTCPNAIHLIFKCKSTCCEEYAGRSAETECKPLSERSPSKALQQINLLKQYYALGYTLKATTITIGEKWLGKLSYQDQYRIFIKRIKKYYPFHGPVKYYYCFELTNNGQLHAHGIEYGGFQRRFIEAFSNFGKRNEHKESYKDIKSDKYFDYIHKECVMPSIHNITKRYIKENYKSPEECKLIMANKFKNVSPGTGDTLTT